MALAKTHEFKGKMFTEVPKEAAACLGIKAGDELEFKTIYDKVVVIVPKEKKKEVKEEPKMVPPYLTASETSVLRKLKKMKHTERTSEKINKVLNVVERRIVNLLLKKKVLFMYKKKGKEYIGIERKYFREVKAATPNPLITKLEKEGFLIIENPDNAKALTKALKAEGKDAFVRGVRSFNKKFYVVTEDELERLEKPLAEALIKERSLKELVKRLRVKEGLCKAILEIMKEEGKVIERRKEVYAAI